MSENKLHELKVLDLVPFGDARTAQNFFALRLSPPNWDGWTPGQFIMIRPKSWGNELIWSRPFSICLVTKRDLVVYFQVSGRGTKQLGELKRGDIIQALGPLGNGFATESETPTLILAGGIGIAPFVGYVYAHPSPWSLHMHFGHRLPLGCYPFDNFSDKIIAENHPERTAADLEHFIQTMDKSIEENAAAGGLVIACGPTLFLKTVQNLSVKHKARTQLSLENRMACGVGACLGCVVKPNVGNIVEENSLAAQPKTTCTCGPVFWADSIEL